MSTSPAAALRSPARDALLSALCSSTPWWFDPPARGSSASGPKLTERTRGLQPGVALALRCISAHCLSWRHEPRKKIFQGIGIIAVEGPRHRLSEPRVHVPRERHASEPPCHVRRQRRHRFHVREPGTTRIKKKQTQENAPFSFSEKQMERFEISKMVSSGGKPSSARIGFSATHVLL